MKRVMSMFNLLGERSSWCLWFFLASLAFPVQAVILEVEPNDIFSNLSDVNDSPDFSLAMLAVNDTHYLGTVGFLGTAQQPPAPKSIDELNPNDLDWWAVDLQQGTRFEVHMRESTTLGFRPGAVLWRLSSTGTLHPVSGNGTALTRADDFNFVPWLSGRYYFGIGDINNNPISIGGANIAGRIFHETESTIGASELASYSGLGGSSFAYELWFEGTVSATASTVPVPAALWLFVSGLLGLGWIGKRRSI